MAEHDFRFSLLSPQHTLIECRALVPGRYQVTGNGGSIKHGDVLIVTLRGSKTLSMRLTVEGDARYSIRPAGQWVAMAQGRSLANWRFTPGRSTATAARPCWSLNSQWRPS